MFKRSRSPFFGKFSRCQVRNSAVRTELVVVPSPALYFVSGIFKRHKSVHVQALVAEITVERSATKLIIAYYQGLQIINRVIRAYFCDI